MLINIQNNKIIICKTKIFSNLFSMLQTLIFNWSKETYSLKSSLNQFVHFDSRKCHTSNHFSPCKWVYKNNENMFHCFSDSM